MSELNKKKPKKYNAKKRHEEMVKSYTQDLIEHLDWKKSYKEKNKRPSSRWWPWAEKEEPVNKSSMNLDSDEMLDEFQRINENDPEQPYKDIKRAEENIEKDMRDEDNTTDKTTDNADKRMIWNCIDDMEEWNLYRWEITAIDKNKNYIVTFYGWDIYGIVYKIKNRPLKVGDRKVFTYIWKNKTGKLKFKLAKHKNKNRVKQLKKEIDNQDDNSQNTTIAA